MSRDRQEPLPRGRPGADDQDRRRGLPSFGEEESAAAGPGINPISDRPVWRWHWRYQAYGDDSLLGRRAGKHSPMRGPLALDEFLMLALRVTNGRR